MMGNTAANFSMPLTAGGKRSLNRDSRKRELTKITKENQLILRRLRIKLQIITFQDGKEMKWTERKS